MIEDNGRCGKGIGKFGDLGQLRMIKPGIEGEVASGQLGETRTPGPVTCQLRRRIGARVADAGIGVPTGLVPDALEAAIAGCDLGIEHGARFAAQAQVDMADDAGAGSQVTIDAAGAHGGNAVGELGLANAAELGRTVFAVHRVTVDENRRDDVVPGPGVGQQVVEHVVIAGTLPQMMVRIDDRQFGFEGGLAYLGDPGRIGSHHVAELRCLFCHCVLYNTGVSPIIETWAAMTFQPTSGKRTHVCICRPVISLPRTL